MKFIDDPDFTLYVGDVREQLAALPDESVHCVVTSPPYWGLRDYGTGEWEGGDPGCDHQKWAPWADAKKKPDSATYSQYREQCGKCGARRVDQQLGLESTPDLYVANMVAVFREVRRVLRRDGTCWVNLGDSYAATQTSDRHFCQPTGPKGTPATKHPPQMGAMRTAVGGLKPKDLVGVPWRVAFALQADGWYLRSDIVWSKPNPMPESVTDRPTKAHEYLFLLTRSPRYFFDCDAIREPHSEPWRSGTTENRKMAKGTDGHGATFGGWDYSERVYNPAGRNVRSVWEIATQPYPEAHFATFPEELPRRCISAGTSERGCCPECGAPWERIVEREEATSDGRSRPSPGDGHAHRSADPSAPQVRLRGALSYTSATTGWRRTCAHDWQLAISPCTVLDPFMGSGTTALVARKLGRRSIGVELNREYAELAARRLSQLSLLAEGTA